MSIESARNFYQRITTDESFLTQLQNTASEESTAFIEGQDMISPLKNGTQLQQKLQRQQHLTENLMKPN
jgi:hypothetical protein